MKLRGTPSARYAFGQVAAADVDFANVAAREGGADLLLDALGGGFADQAAVVAAHVGDDGFVEAVAADADGFGVDNTVEGNQGDLGSAAADVYDHRAAGLLDRQAGADGGSHRLFDQEHLAGAGAQGGFADGPALNLGGLARHADQHAWAGLQEAVLVDLVDEVLQHLLADAEIRDHAVFHRTDGGDVARGTAEHALGLGAHGDDALLAAMAANGDHGRFVQDDAALAHINKGIGSTQVDRQIAGKHATQFFEHGKETLGEAWVKNTRVKKCGKL